MATDDELERGGKRILLGLHRAGSTFAHGGGALIDSMTGGQLQAAKAFDQLTENVGLAYAEVGALPTDSPEARYIAIVRQAEQKANEAQAAQQEKRIEEGRRLLAALGAPAAPPPSVAPPRAVPAPPPAAPSRSADLEEGRRLLSQLGRRT